MCHIYIYIIKNGAILIEDIVAIGAILMDIKFKVHEKFFDESQVDNDTLDFYENNRKMFNNFKYYGVLNIKSRRETYRSDK
uniref:Uncharacterized protein n=1 Tax=viral metagenome TaxID=1070528 RepID=A0A6C0ACU5_9ZZZZ